MTKEWSNYCDRQEEIDAALNAFKDMDFDAREMPLFRHYQLQSWLAYKVHRRAAA